jgi:hypothetical protein
MSTSKTSAKLLSITVTDHYLTARLSDGRVVSNPLEWCPRLLNASPDERKAFEISGGGVGVHWEKIDEDLLMLAQSSDSTLLTCRSGFMPDTLGRPSGINPDPQPNCVTLFREPR